MQSNVRSSPIKHQDLSITSDAEDQESIDFCEGQIFKYKPSISFLDSDLYPEVFQFYPQQLVKALDKFTKPFSHHTVTKLLNYEANMAFLISQIGFKLGQIKNYYEHDKTLWIEFKLFEFYLYFHSLYNTSQLYEMLRILLGKKEMSYKWPLDRKNAFNDLKKKYFQEISEDNGMQLMKRIDYFHLAVAKKCSRQKYCENYVPLDLNKTFLKLFDNNETKPLIIRMNVIKKNIEFDQLRIHFDDKELQQHLNSCTQNYFKSLYKQIFSFAQKNDKDRRLIELLYLILVAKLNSEDFPFWILKYIEKEKVKITSTSKIIQADNYTSFILESNIFFRAQLPKVYLLVKKNGFMKLTSFLHESGLIDIMKELNWVTNYFQNKSIKSKFEESKKQKR